MNILDYAWYRVAKLYYRWDSDGITASAFTGLSLGLLVNDLIYLALNWTNAFDSFHHTVSRGTYGKIGLILTLSIVAYNYFRYRKRYRRFREKWKDERKGIVYTAKGLAVILGLIFPLMMLFFLLR